MSIGTFNCPICGFDKPHPHEAVVVEWHRSGIAPKGYIPGPLNKAQRMSLRREAEHWHHVDMLKKKFEANPRAYVNKYGSINSFESSFLVGWLLARIDRLEKARESGPAVDVEAETVLRIVEWIRSGRVPYCETLAVHLERGDWRKGGR